MYLCATACEINTQRRIMTSRNIAILKELKTLLSMRLNDNLIDIVLFGSQLSGKNNQNSDYDILILVKNNFGWKFEKEISDICYDIDLKYGILTDTHVLSETELASLRGRQPIFANAVQRGLRV